MTNNTTFSFAIRVYYEDTDAGGVVYHSQYLNFMERARTEALRACGFEQDALRDEHKVLFVVHEMQLRFKKPAKFNQEIVVQTQLRQLGRSALVFAQQIVRDATVLIEATVQVACVEAHTFKPIRIPDAIRQTLATHVVTTTE